MELSEAVKKIRMKIGVSQEGFARELHVGFTTVNRWEKGHARPNQIARHAILELCVRKGVEQCAIDDFKNAT